MKQANRLFLLPAVIISMLISCVNNPEKIQLSLIGNMPYFVNSNIVHEPDKDSTIMVVYVPSQVCQGCWLNNNDSYFTSIIDTLGAHQSLFIIFPPMDSTSRIFMKRYLDSRKKISNHTLYDENGTFLSANKSLISTNSHDYIWVSCSDGSILFSGRTNSKRDKAVCKRLLLSSK